MKITVKDKQMLMWKTSVKYKTLAPEYNEQFSYEVTDSMKMGMDMENMTISLDICNHDRFKINDKMMGSISIGKDAPTKLGRQHWAKVLKYPSSKSASGIQFNHRQQEAEVHHLSCLITIECMCIL